MKAILTCLVAMSVAACGGMPDPGPVGSGGSGGAGGSGGSGGGAQQAATCKAGLTTLTPGQAITLRSTSAGNLQRDYCFLVGPSAREIKFELRGGDCAPYTCMGDDLHMGLKKGEVPDMSYPDSSVKQWTYTPNVNGYGVYGKGATEGAWYLSLRDDANTLGYKSVSLTLSLQNL